MGGRVGDDLMQAAQGEGGISVAEQGALHAKQAHEEVPAVMLVADVHDVGIALHQGDIACQLKRKDGLADAGRAAKNDEVARPQAHH